MSHLREIMQRLNAASARQAGQGASQDPGGPDPLLGLQARHYAEQLAACSEAMLRYEAAWLEQHRAALELCRVRPEMRQVAGGALHLEQLLAETGAFERLLAEELDRRGLRPDPHHHTVVATEHAWELSNASIRRAWGL